MSSDNHLICSAVVGNCFPLSISSTQAGAKHSFRHLFPGSSITSLQKKTWFTAEPNSAPLSQYPDLQYMTSMNTYTSLYVGQNWSNIRSFWPNYALAKPVTHCLGGFSPAVVIGVVTIGLRRWNRRAYRSWLE
jgi:hypothetical protein